MTKEQIVQADGQILVHVKTGKIICKGDEVISFRDEKYIIYGGSAARGNSSGKVWVHPEGTEYSGLTAREFYPSVFNLKWA